MNERLLDVLYRSVLQPENVGEFVTELQRATGALNTAISVHDFSTNSGYAPILLGAPVEAVLAYEQHYAAQNLWMERTAPYMYTGAVVVSDDYTTLAELKRSVYWRDFLSLLDIDHGLGICGLFDQGKLVLLNALYSHRQARSMSRGVEILKQLAPHWVNACAIQRKLGLLEETLTSMQQALNKVALAVALIDANGAVCRTNEGAEWLLRSGRLIGLRNQRLVASQPQDAREFDRALAATLASGPEFGTVPNVTMRLILHDALGQPAAFVSVHTLVVSRAPDAETRPARALVFIRPLNGGDARDLSEALVTLYGLTTAEARFAVALHTTGDIGKASAEVGIRADTARTKMKFIHDKMGTHSQAGLTKLISDLSFTLGRV